MEKNIRDNVGRIDGWRKNNKKHGSHLGQSKKYRQEQPENTNERSEALNQWPIGLSYEN